MDSILIIKIICILIRKFIYFLFLIGEVKKELTARLGVEDQYKKSIYLQTKVPMPMPMAKPKHRMGYGRRKGKNRKEKFLCPT